MEGSLGKMQTGHGTGFELSVHPSLSDPMQIVALEAFVLGLELFPQNALRLVMFAS